MQAIVVRNDVRIAIHLEVKLHGAARAPKEMCVRSGKMIEEEFAAGKPLVGGSEILLQRLLCQRARGFLRAGRVAELRGIEDAGQMRMDPPLNQPIIEMASSSSIELDGSSLAAG